MRTALAAVAVVALGGLTLSACGARATSGPAWPKMAERENDGGEALAPRPRARAIAAAASADSDDDIKVVSSGTSDAKPAAASSATTPAASAAAGQTEDVPITVEDIVIEIDD